MSNICSNCYNGCVETTSDQCVKYTGVNVPVLGIQTGDSLSYVEQALITFLTSTLDGTGIKPVIDPAIICNLVNQYLPDCEDLNATNLFIALIKAACDLQEQVDAVVADVAVIEAPYTVGCLTGVTGSSGTHAIVQAVITKLCGLEVELDALALDVDTNYVKLSDLNSLIAAYIASIGTSTKYYNRMVPYAVVEYYGSLTGKFDGTGAGIVGTDWEKIYLCNGNNGTPDKRGRVPVGATTGMGGGPFNPAVDPGIAGNPSYALLGTAGSNTVTLGPTQIPAHSHLATATVTDPGHLHTIAYAHGEADQNEPGTYGDLMDMNGTKSSSTSTNTAFTGVSVAVAVGSTGGGLAHDNFQPGLGCYYIMYIP